MEGVTVLNYPAMYPAYQTMMRNPQVHDQRLFPYGGAIPFLTGLAVGPLLFGGYRPYPFYGPYGGFGYPGFGPRPFFW